MTVQIGVPRETERGEVRVALTPDGARRLLSDHIKITVESGAGAAAGFPDSAYEEVGVEIAPDSAKLLWADIVLKVAPPTESEADQIGQGSVLACFMRPHENRPLIKRLAEGGVSVLALELVPRITRAQSMDALSSQSNLAGYKAVLLGANSLGRIFPLLMTAAGTLSPARVLVLGAGVAGLQAIATARRLGADTWGYDIRAAVREEVESLGARFVDLDDGAAGRDPGVVGEGPGTAGGGTGADGQPAAPDGEGEGGYARELEEAEQARQREALARHIARADVVITTALVPGRPAPVLITADVVERMKPGSVIVDLAGEAGGNCALSTPGETTVERGVTIHAPRNVPASLPYHASQLLGRNLTALVKPLIGEDGVTVDLDDDVIGPCCVAHADEVRFGA